MPDYIDDENEEKREPCAGIKMELVECLLATDCVQKENKSLKECLRSNHPSVPQECHSFRMLYFECKRSMLDNRARFRGRKGY